MDWGKVVHWCWKLTWVGQSEALKSWEGHGFEARSRAGAPRPGFRGCAACGGALWTPLHLCFLMVAITSRRTEAAPAWTPRARVSGCLARRCPALLGMADAGAGSVLRLQESIWPQGCGSSFSLRLCSFPLLHPPLATHTCISTSGPRFENCSC